MASGKRSFGWVRGTIRRQAQMRWLGSARVVGWACHNQKLPIWQGLPRPLPVSSFQQWLMPDTKEEEQYIYNKAGEWGQGPHFCSIMVSDCTSASKIFSRPTGVSKLLPLLTLAILLSPTALVPQGHPSSWTIPSSSLAQGFLTCPCGQEHSFSGSVPGWLILMFSS